MQNIIVFWRISFQMKFTIFCDGMVQYNGTDVLLESGTTVQDRKLTLF